MLIFARLSVRTLVLSSRVQGGSLFRRTFGSDEALTASVPTCSLLSVLLDTTNSSTSPTPPFYMIAFALGGTPVTNFIGTDPNNLTWTVTQPVGSQLVLSVVDANGRPSTSTSNILTVIPGQTTECVTAPPTTPLFTISANATSTTELTACQPWNVTIQGGNPPLTVTLVQPDSPNFTNVTTLGFNLLSYLDRANPNSQLIAAVSDSTGRWATGTPVINTTDSTDTSCEDPVTSPGIASNSTSSNSTSPDGNSTTTPQQGGARSGDKSKDNHHTIIVAVSVPLVLLTLIVLGGTTVYTWQRKRRGQTKLPQILSRVTIESKSPIDNEFDPASLYSPPRARLAHDSNPSLPSLSNTAPTVALSYDPKEGNSWTTKTLHTYLSSVSNPQRSSQGSSPANLPENSVAGPSTKPLPLLPDAGQTSRLHDSDELPTNTVAHRPSLSVVNVDEDPEVVFHQHRDAGPVHVEIPPPYPASDSHAR